jgi:hypothetical protein
VISFPAILLLLLVSFNSSIFLYPLAEIIDKEVMEKPIRIAKRFKKFPLIDSGFLI